MNNLNLPLAPVDQRFENLNVIIIKITHRCNIDCLYCYENISGNRRDDMTIETFITIIDKVLSNSKCKLIGFILHGGEPTILSESWLERALEHIRQQAKTYSKAIYIILQTNLISISDYHFRLTKQFGVRISGSLDGPVGLPSPMRPHSNRAIQNYYRFLEHGIQPSVLMTINHSTYRHFHEIMKWLENDLKVTSFQANVVSSVGSGHYLSKLTSEQIFEAHLEIIEHMISNKGSVIEHNLSEEILRFFATDNERNLFPKSNCHEKSCSAGSGVLSVAPDGNLLPCGRLPWDETEHLLGSVSIIDNRRFQESVVKFHNVAPENWNSCDTCFARRICAHGCQAFIVKTKELINVECNPTKMRYEFYSRHRDQLEPVVKTIRARNEYGFAKKIYPSYERR